ncbi:hypothetical protein ACTHOS_10135 [Bacillus safensis]|uniref:hypothetical protein n=1 Tax=Bacillus TaxID=1386 RepID=UPI000AF4365D|nr:MULTISPECIES: hypothetical protein [Bacillus]MBT2259918.1 hypothetical protein [Bacillus safensis]MBU8603107.1 hypothetical protein [Bacillus safensis]MBU8615468.1 hypothetical protein [Bacillus safensis]MBU8626657.1 hypothetical protein [Bacillus safensis]MCY1095615.1 hypothetical protein [Bacillus safensis]
MPKSLNNESMQIDLKILNSFLYKLEKIDWSVQGEMKYLKGVSGSKTLAKELLSLLDEK